MKPPLINKSQIYLDSQATTPVDQAVLEEMWPYFTAHYANGNHRAGWKVNSALEKSRQQVASLINARPTELIFTSGATESINLAIQGLAKSAPVDRRHIISQKTEHKAVLANLDYLRGHGFKISLLDVDEFGRIRLEELERLVNKQTLLVAIMLANNEIGTIQPIQEIGEITRRAGATFFCDLSQGLGWYPIDVDRMKIDLAAMSSHKIYGPRGAGALFVRRFKPKTTLNPILFGGGQEQNLRPGTSNVPAMVGFGKACEIYQEEGDELRLYIKRLRDRLKDQICSSIEGTMLNGCPVHRHPGNLNLTIPGLSGEELIGALPHIIFSTGSACTSASTQGSYVLRAISNDPTVQQNSFRLGVGKFNTSAEIDMAAQQIIEVASSASH